MAVSDGISLISHSYHEIIDTYSQLAAIFNVCGRGL